MSPVNHSCGKDIPKMAINIKICSPTFGGKTIVTRPPRAKGTLINSKRFSLTSLCPRAREQCKPLIVLNGFSTSLSGLKKREGTTGHALCQPRSLHTYDYILEVGWDPGLGTVDAKIKARIQLYVLCLLPGIQPFFFCFPFPGSWLCVRKPGMLSFFVCLFVCFWENEVSVERISVKRAEENEEN